MSASTARPDARPRIAYLSANDPQNLRAWSGTEHFMARALQRHCGEVVHLGPVHPPFKAVIRLVNKALRRLGRQGIDYRCTWHMVRRYATVFERRLAQGQFDFIFAPAASAELTFLETDVPIVYASDVTFALIREYYPGFAGMSRRAARVAALAEQAAIQKAAVILYPSQWAARSAIRDYNADEHKVHIIPVGANIEEAPDRQTVLERDRGNECRLLFLGKDWARKGGPIALETLLELEKRGLPARLTVCGCTPPPEFSHRRLQVIPFLNKADPEQGRQFVDLLLNSSLLLLPTRRECSPIAFCEANAFGLPVVTTNTGGVAGLIHEGENGFMLPPSAGGADYAELIWELWQDRPRYCAMVRSSRNAFDEQLNWDAWGRAVQRIIRAHLDGLSDHSNP